MSYLDRRTRPRSWPWTSTARIWRCWAEARGGGRCRGPQTSTACSPSRTGPRTARSPTVSPPAEPGSRDWWQGRDLLGRRRTAMLGRNLYAHGLLGRTIRLAHLLCPAAWLRPAPDDGGDLACRAARAVFAREIAPVLRSPIVAMLARSPAALFGLGIPPAQFASMQAEADPLAIVRERLRAAGLRLRHPRQLVRLAGLRPPLSGRRPHRPTLPPAGELPGRARERGPGRAAPRRR